MDPSAGDEAGLGQDLARVGRILAQIVAPTTFIASVLMYFGSVRLSTMYWKFGVNSSMLSFTFQDYVLRSIDVVEVPLVLFLLGLLVVLRAAPFAHKALIRCTSRHRDATVGAILALATLGFASIAVAMVAMFDQWRPPPPFLVAPLCLDVGVILVYFSVYLYTINSGPVVSSTSQIVQRTVLAAFLLISLLWVVTHRAKTVGEEDAQKVEATMLGVVVYAPQPLNMKGPGITETPLMEPNARYRYQYTGLRLLIHSNRQYFLLPACRGSAPEARAIALPADGSVRLETFKVEKKPTCP
ncbi:hypothetical protein ACIBQ1_34640 [Nonomuraea sp. NPDC050153]|uniref:hypothetical protein n=1 Tax=Nonomuraea sp. NPDC050153 TaxID=3364359 RepID=UPI0037A4F85B